MQVNYCFQSASMPHEPTYTVFQNSAVETQQLFGKKMFFKENYLLSNKTVILWVSHLSKSMFPASKQGYILILRFTNV